MWANILLVLGAYLFGSIPHLSLLAKTRRVELDGDFHENLWYRAGKLVGFLGVLGEFTKGVLPILAGKALGFDILVVALAGLAAVCGQMWPVFSKFDGEKGNSVAIAMMIALTPIPGLISIIPTIVSLLIRTTPRFIAKIRKSGEDSIVGGPYSHSLPVGMFVCFLILPFVAWYLEAPVAVVWCCSLLFLVIMIRRLTAGLREDLKTHEDIGGILLRRLLFDRSTAGWRKNQV